MISNIYMNLVSPELKTVFIISRNVVSWEKGDQQPENLSSTNRSVRLSWNLALVRVDTSGEKAEKQRQEWIITAWNSEPLLIQWLLPKYDIIYAQIHCSPQ